jgi:hypothetical protein
MEYIANKSEDFLKAYKNHLTGRHVKRFLEIGVQFGGSLKIWRDYFPDAEIIGVDNDPRCENYIKNFPLFIGDQTDKKFMESLGEFDVIVDDGGHKMSQQQDTFNIMFPNLKKGGLYVIEDLHTSYWEEFLDERPTTEFIKDMIDHLHEYATDTYRNTSKVQHINKHGVQSLHVYPGIVFIEKCT